LPSRGRSRVLRAWLPDRPTWSGMVYVAGLKADGLE
jgi:hypothetical protein